MRTRIRPKTVASRPNVITLFQSSVPYRWNVAGQFLITWGAFFPFFYIQAYAKASAVDETLTFYLIAIVNAASIVGRITTNFVADHVGPVNVMVFISALTSVITFALIGAKSSASLIVLSLLIGFFTGSFFSLGGPALIACALDDNEIGARYGIGMAVSGLAALTGSPIAGALATRYGYLAAISFAGSSIISGSASYAVGGLLLRRGKGSWKV